MDTIKKYFQLLFLVISIIFLGACSSPENDSASNNIPPDLSADTVSINFESLINDSLPPAKKIHISWTDPDIKSVSAIAPDGELIPSWINLSITSESNIANLDVSVNITSSVATTYSMTLRIAGADKNGNVIDHIDIPITYKITDQLLASTPSLSYAYTFGSSILPASQLINLTGDSINWNVTSSESWVTFNHASGTTPDNILIAVDTAGLPAGTHSATVTFSDTDSSLPNNTVINITLDISLPAIAVSTASLVLGGENGRDFSPATLQFNLDTGTNYYPWSTTLTTDTGSWLISSSYSGNLSSTNVGLTIDAIRTGLAGGTHAGNITIDVDVSGQIISQSVPVTLLLDAHKIFVSDTGIAFTSTPTISKLTSNITVEDSFGYIAPWAATSDQPWLGVTASGYTDQQLVLTADPTGLASNTIHYATISISSPDSNIANTETIRAALWVGSTDPNTADSLALTYSEIVADPIRPYVYMNNSGTSIDIYNVYTASLVSTIPDIVAQAGDMVISHDGSTLYVADKINYDIIPVNLDTYTTGNTIDLTGSGNLWAAYARVRTRELLFISNGATVDAKTGSILPNTFTINGSDYAGSVPDVSQDGSMFCGVKVGLSPYSIECYALDHSEINNGTLFMSSKGTGAHGIGSNVKDVALTHDGKIAYVASGAPYVFVGYDTATMTQIQSLPAAAYPNCVEIGPDNLLYGGIASYYGTTDIWIYNTSGFEQYNNYLSGYAKTIADRQLVVSGDGVRVITSVTDPAIKIVTAP